MKAKFTYKQTKQEKPYCTGCETFIQGNGSSVLPYECKCGKWEYSPLKSDYILIRNDD